MLEQLKRITAVILVFTCFLIGSCVMPGTDEGGDNSNQGNENITAPPQFSLEAGTYPTNQTVTITSPDGGDITYSLTSVGENSGVNNTVPVTTIAEETINLNGPGVRYTITASAQAPGKDPSSTVVKEFYITGKLEMRWEEVGRNGIYPRIRLYAIDSDLNEVADSTIFYTQVIGADLSLDKENGVTFSYLTPEDALEVNDSNTIKALAYKEGWVTSDLFEDSYPLTLSFPVFTPDDANPALKGTPVIINHSVANTDRYYKIVPFGTDLSGVDLSAASTYLTDTVNDGKFSVGLPLDEPVKIIARAYHADWDPSALKVATYRLKLPKPSVTPVPTPGQIFSSARTVTMTPPAGIAGVKIKYTLDGSDPKDPASGAIDYAGDITIENSSKVRAYCYMPVSGGTPGWTDSDVTEVDYNFLVETPRVSLNSCVTDTEVTVTIIMDSFVGVEVYYTLGDLNEPAAVIADKTVLPAEYIRYNSGDTITIERGKDDATPYRATLKVRAYRFVANASVDSSSLVTREYDFKLRQPKSDTSAIVRSAPFQVALGHDLLDIVPPASDVIIKYSTDNSNWDTYDSAIPVEINVDTNLYAKATRPGWQDSDSIDWFYDLKPLPPIFKDPTGFDSSKEYRDVTQITAYDQNTSLGPTFSPTIYFSKDYPTIDPANDSHIGRDSRTSGGVINIDVSTTLVGVSYIADWGYSDVVMNDYTLRVKDLVFSLPADIYTLPVGADPPIECEISCATDGVRVYYTKDGATPSTSSDYFDLNSGTPFKMVIDKNTHLKAVATKTDWKESSPFDAPTAAEYFVELPIPVLTDFVPQNAAVLFDTIVDGGDAGMTTYIYMADDRPFGQSTIKAPITGIQYKYNINEPGVSPLTGIGFFNDNFVADGVETTYRVIATSGTNYLDSPIRTAIYKAKVQTPVFETVGTADILPAHRYYDGSSLTAITAPACRIITGNDLTLSCSTVNSTIKYKIVDLGGAELVPETIVSPDASGKVVVPVPDSSPFKVIMHAERDDAADGMWINSEIVEQTYYRQLATPDFSNTLNPSALNDATDTDVSMSITTTATGYAIHYTQAGGTSVANPDHTSAVYGTARNITDTTSFKAIALKTGWIASSVSPIYTVYRCKVDGVSKVNGSTFPYGNTNVVVTATYGSNTATVQHSFNSWTDQFTDSTIGIDRNRNVVIRAKANGCMASADTNVSYKVESKAPVTNPNSSTLNYGGSRTITLSNDSGEAIDYIKYRLYRLSNNSLITSGTVPGSNSTTVSVDENTRLETEMKLTEFELSQPTIRNYNLRLAQPTLPGTTTLLYSNRVITLAPNGSNPSGTGMRVSTGGGYSALLAPYKITLNSGSTTVSAYSYKINYNNSATAYRTYVLKLNTPVYSSTVNVGSPTVTARKVTFTLPASYPSGAYIQISKNGGGYVNGGVIDIGLTATTLRARVVASGYSTSDSITINVPAH